jgi:thioredoxin reductase (NADPH)
MTKYRSQVLIVGGGLAGLSAAIYLGRAKREALIVDEGRTMARWEPDVQNYLGFPAGVGGEELVKRGRAQARRYHTRFNRDRIISVSGSYGSFCLRGQKAVYHCERLLLATGIFHLPPELPGVAPCLGHSMFFCKDCDGYRVQGKSVAIYGWTNEAVEYALGLLLYSSCVSVVTDGHSPKWDAQHSRWIEEYQLPIYDLPITGIERKGSNLRALLLSDAHQISVEALFTTRGDVYFNELARELGARVDAQGEILVDHEMRTSVEGLYAAGCVTPANCQMIIAAGQGAAAGQAINRDLFEASLGNHRLRRYRSRQLRTRTTRPKVRRQSRNAVDVK